MPQPALVERWLPTAPVGTDNCPGATTTRTAGPASGSTFPVGVTTVTHQVADASGQTASCSFTVTVTDNQNPVLGACPANVVRCETNPVVTFSTPSASDNCPGVTVSQITGLPSGSSFPLGTTTNTFRATDAYGNLSGTCSFTVTVVQQIASVSAAASANPICRAAH
ncbi:MAG: HYR domain-containing protein [Bacteroidetes bacterium]|nr:HYR domain-containing protein [Bacteroidota bacterium]